MERACVIARCRARFQRPCVYLARAYLGTRQFDRAIVLLKQSDPTISRLRGALPDAGIAEAEQHGAAAAKPYIERGIELGPEVALGYNLLGNLNLRGGDYENAFRNYRKAADLAPGNDRYSYDAALALERMNRVAEAIPFAEKSIRLNSGPGCQPLSSGKTIRPKQPRYRSHSRTGSLRSPESTSGCSVLPARSHLHEIRPAKKCGGVEPETGRLKEAKNRRVGLAGPVSESSDIQNAPLSWDRDSLSGLPQSIREGRSVFGSRSSESFASPNNPANRILAS